MNVSHVVRVLEQIAPPQLAEDWDNVGLLIGDSRSAVQRLMLCIDLTQAVLAEALAVKATMVMAYHSVIFRPVSRLTAETQPVAYEAARRGLAVYSMHTAWDAAAGGLNDIVAGAIGVADRRPLETTPLAKHRKVTVFVPPMNLAAVADAAFAAGAGAIGDYRECGFAAPGEGTFRGLAGTHPAVGQAGRREAVEELRMEVTCPAHRVAEVCAAIRAAHPYEEPAIDVYPLEDYPDGCGMGRVGRLENPTALPAMLRRIKQAAGVKSLWVARPSGSAPAGKIRTVAVAAGSSGGLWRAALAAGAELLVTGEMRHHDALAASAAGLTVACLGHSNSERLGLSVLADQIRHRLPSLKVSVSRKDRDPFEVS